jgi:topoisomerase-4 subunit A
MNMNVLSNGVTPRVLGLADVLREWLAHRRIVLQRRSRFRLGQIDKRLEILSGLLIVYLDLDRVIKIIREEDEPKLELMRVFAINEVQTDAILNTRLRSLRKLEEMELKREFEKLSKEKADIEALLGSDSEQWKTITAQIREVKKAFSLETALGKRRSSFAIAPVMGDIDLTEGMVEREPLTVVVTEMGWIRALKGHVTDLTTLQFKGDDALKISFHTETTAKILVLTTDGKIYTLEASKLPGGRGFGDPIRLMADIDEGAAIVDVLPYRPNTKLLIASSIGRGFVSSAEDVVANTRKGRQVLNVDAKETARLIVTVEGDQVAVIGENRKLLCFPLVQMAEMARGKGVRIQKYKDGGISDLKTFTLADGLTWRDTSGRTWTVSSADLAEWIGNRAEAGRLPPKGFPKSNRFSG